MYVLERAYGRDRRGASLANHLVSFSSLLLASFSLFPAACDAVSNFSASRSKPSRFLDCGHGLVVQTVESPECSLYGEPRIHNLNCDCDDVGDQ